MATSTAFANRGTITVGGPSNLVPTVETLAVIKDVELTISAEHVPLYGWGSILRQGVAKHSLKVSVKVGWVKFNPFVGATGGWIFSIGASPGQVATGAWTNTNAVHLFDVNALFTFEDGQTLNAKITNVYFPDLPLKASEGQWVRLDMAGEGETILFTNP